MADLSTASVQTADWAAVAIEAFRADPLKFVIFSLVVLVMFFGWIIAKFIDAKFISRQTNKVVDASAGIKLSNETTVEANKKLKKELEEKLEEHARAVTRDWRMSQEEISKLRRELNDKLDREMRDFKIAIGAIADGNKTTAAAIAKYQEQQDILKSNFEKILAGLKKRQEGS